MDSEKRWVVEKEKQLTPQTEQYIAQIESWLDAQDADSVAKLIALFGDAKFVETYVPYFETLHFAYIAVLITRRELNKTSEPYFLRNGRNLSDLEMIIRKLRFALWRMEFLDAGSAGSGLMELCTEYVISPDAIHQIISMNSVSPKKSYLAAAGTFLENGRAGIAKEIVSCALERYPADEDFVNLSKLL